ncbi:PQQ-binding-like beta-propeller repeat protein, partial [Idiomarina abyssalis]|uniref:PQQ-binding-like beta-propeller repeat protein n=1 Tax=Idiomarina abyssalis TaxID=86102 RepID=UPI003A8CCE56
MLQNVINKLCTILLLTISMYTYSDSVYRGDNNHNNYYGDKKIYGNEISWEFKAGDRPIDISPIYNDLNIFIATTDGYIYSLDKKSGIENWSVKLDTKLTSQLYIHNDSLVVGDDDGSIYTINTFNKKIEKVYNVINERTIMNPFHKDGVIYTTHDKGYICTLVPTLENKIDCYSTRSTFFAGP